MRYLFCIFGILGLCLSLLVSKTCFLSFSTQNHAESSRNFVKKLNLEPKTCRIGPKVRNMSPYGPIWSRPGPLKRAWARPGPLKSGKSSGKTHPFFKTYFYEKIVSGLQTVFFDGFNVLLSFLAEK